MKEKCCICGKMAVYFYMPGVEFLYNPEGFEVEEGEK